MIAAIYARKSTEQSGVADEQKSVTRQIEHATAYATRQGWTVDAGSIFVDDGISGAEFANRPGFLRLMNALKPRPSFQGLIMSEVSRLGREQIETAYALKQLSVAGVRCFSYLEDRELLLETATDKFLLGAVTFAADLEREKARQRTYDAMVRKARAGHVTGGRSFGYDNVEILGSDGRRSHVERRINDAEAGVVRRIFDLCARGTGYTGIAKLLNADHAPAPRPQQDRPAGWSPSTVNEILHRSLYRGEVMWNRSRKRNRWGQQHQTARPSEEWMRLDVPSVRVVSEGQWHAAHARLSGIRAQLEQVTGRAVDGRHGPRRRGNESAYLLSGFARCAVCGGGLGVTSSRRKGQRLFFYACTAYHKRGTAVCGNGLVLPVDRVNDAVLQTLAGDVLRPAVVMAVIDGVLEQLAPTTAARARHHARTELQAVERTIGHLATAIGAGGPLESLLAELKAQESRRDILRGAIAAAERSAGAPVSRNQIERTVRRHVDGWRALLTSHVQDGRRLLREVLAGPLRFTPTGRTYRFEGEAAIGRLLAGMAGLPTVLASPPGFANGCTERFVGIAA